MTLPKPNSSRRKAIQHFGLAMVSVPVLSILGCGGSKQTNLSTTSGTSADSTSTSNSANESTSTTTETSVTSSSNWASGGTATMTASFPDDSLFTLASTCVVALTGALTEGPCYFSVDTVDDISDGQPGLPMQLCLRLIDSDCSPLAGYEVEVWHCDVNGVYSGDTSDSSDATRFAGSFCTGNDSDALKSTWFRGTQVTDSNGRVNFKSCFPGWYSGRTIHIHFRVRNNYNDEVISQFCFSDTFTKEICTSHPEYLSRGEQDTPLSQGRDTVYGSQYSDYLFDLAQNEDGSLLAYKTIQIR